MDSVGCICTYLQMYVCECAYNKNTLRDHEFDGEWGGHGRNWKKERKGGNGKVRCMKLL